MIDTRKSKEGEELAIWITGSVGEYRAKVIGHSERHGGTAVLQVLDTQTGEPSKSLASFALKGEDYIARSRWVDRS